MAGSVNKVILVGNLGADPEVRRLGSGEPVVNLRIATSESWRDKQSGERKEKTEWHSVVIFNENLAKIAEQYLKKGSNRLISSRPPAPPPTTTICVFFDIIPQGSDVHYASTGWLDCWDLAIERSMKAPTFRFAA